MKNKEKNKSDDVKQVLKNRYPPMNTIANLATLNTEINSFWST